MMDSIVQLIRNAMCCAKDWEIFSDTMLYDASHTNSMLKAYLQVELPEYVNKTTPLEAIISITQLYACLSCAHGGMKLSWTSVGKLRRIVRLLEGKLSTPIIKTKTTTTTQNFVVANRIVNESLIKEAKSAMRNAFVGLLVAPIGFAFFWLFANSWHVTEAGYIGGLTALIDALTVMEVCMIPLLYYMVVDGFKQFTTLQQTKECIDVVTTSSSKNAKKTFNPDYMNVTRYEFMEPGWVPFYGEGTTGSDSSEEETKKVAAETKQVEQTLDLWFAPSSNDKDDDNEKDAKIRKEAIGNAIDVMNKSLWGLSANGYREFLYLVLNFIAFYGYLMAIVGFYYPDDDFQPTWIQAMKFGYDNDFADWSGNFAGDLMWTIEPIVILTSPFYFSYMQSVVVTTSGDAKKSAAIKAKTE